MSLIRGWALGTYEHASVVHSMHGGAEGKRDSVAA